MSTYTVGPLHQHDRGHERARARCGHIKGHIITKRRRLRAQRGDHTKVCNGKTCAELA